MIKSILLIISPFALQGCATTAEQQNEYINKNLSEAKAQIDTCFREIDDRKIYDSIRSKWIKTDDDILMLSNQQRPTKIEAQTLANYANEIRRCRKLRTNLMRNISPQLAIVSQENTERKDSVYIALIQQKTSWGGAIQRMNEIDLDSMQKEAAVFAIIDSNLQNQHNEEIAQRQATAAAMQRAGYAMQQTSFQQQALNQNQQIINNMNRPIQTNCNRLGSNVNCVTY